MTETAPDTDRIAYRIGFAAGRAAALSPEEKALIIDVLREIPDMDLRMAEIRPSRQREIDERRALADRLEDA